MTRVGKPQVADDLDDPSKFLLGSEKHVHYWHEVLDIDGWFNVKALKHIDHVHLDDLKDILFNAERQGNTRYRYAMQWRARTQNASAGECEQIRIRFDSELEHRSVSWKVGAMFMFQMDLGYVKLSMDGHGHSRWSDIREFLIFEFRPFGIEDLSGLDQESREKAEQQELDDLDDSPH